MVKNVSKITRIWAGVSFKGPEQDDYRNSEGRGSRGAVGARGSFRRRLGGKGKMGLRDSGMFFIYIGIFFKPPKKKVTYDGVDFFNEHKEKARLHAKAKGTETRALGSAIPLGGE
jgi:hypothetical protein